MIKIGEFSKLAQVPIATLRYYDQVGLLKPDKVDATSSYRYYSVSQLRRLNRILALKGLGFSLEQIAAALDDGLTLEQMRKLRAPAPEANTMTDSIVRRTKEKGISGDWQARATTIVATSVYPALDRQIALMERLKPTTRPGDGAQRLDQIIVEPVVDHLVLMPAAIPGERTVLIDDLQPEEAPDAYSIQRYAALGGDGLL